MGQWHVFLNHNVSACEFLNKELIAFGTSESLWSLRRRIKSYAGEKSLWNVIIGMSLKGLNPSVCTSCDVDGTGLLIISNYAGQMIFHCPNPHFDRFSVGIGLEHKANRCPSRIEVSPFQDFRPNLLLTAVSLYLIILRRRFFGSETWSYAFLFSRCCHRST